MDEEYKKKLERTVYSLRLNKKTDNKVRQWLAEQSNINNSLLYLIEKEILENGIRDLQLIVPARRNISSNTELSDKIDSANSKEKINIESNNSVGIVDNKIKSIPSGYL